MMSVALQMDLHTHRFTRSTGQTRCQMPSGRPTEYVTVIPTVSTKLVSGRSLFNVIDDEHFHRPLSGFKLQAELLRNRAENRWPALVVRYRAVIRRPDQLYLKSSIKPGLIHDEGFHVAR